MKKEIKFLTQITLAGVVFIGTTISFSNYINNPSRVEALNKVNLYEKAKNGDKNAQLQIEAIEAAIQSEIELNRQKAQKEADKILSKLSEPIIGMSESEVAKTFGNPQKINKTVTSFGTHLQCVYGNGRYIYLDDGIVTSYQGSDFKNILKK